MNRTRRTSLAVIASCFALGCLSTVSNGTDVLPPLPGTGDAGVSVASDASTPAADTGVGTAPPLVSDGGTSDAGSPIDSDGAVAGGSLAGTGANCSTYGPAMGDKCAGKYCAVTAAQIDSAIAQPRTGKCTLVTGQIACKGAVTTAVGKCARSEKSKIENALKTNAELRPLVQACVYKEPNVDMAVTTPECLGCYITSAECSGDACLDACLLGDSKACDDCREKAGCNNPVAACTGLPDPR